MYFFEWFAWKVKTAPAFKKNSFTMTGNKYQGKEAGLYENDILADQKAAKLCASQTPMSRGPIYAYNACFIEMRSGFFETHRGYVTILSIAILSFIGQLTFGLSEVLLIRWRAISEGAESGFDYGFITLTFFVSLDLLLIIVYCKYGFIISRMELFTSRHLLIRFNRKTQQVYLHRPKYCGGITVLPWEGIMSEGSSTAPGEKSGLDIPLILSWSAETTKIFGIECAAVGKRGNNMSELRDEWEFIRRFMDEGPEGLPRPHITSHFPWPWQAFVAPLEGLGQYLVNSNKTIKWGLVFLWPAIFVFGFAHWISLLLCWKPRWPKAIREAGLPGKPVPPLTTLEDFPPHIQQRLRDNAHIWAAKPGSPPEKKLRKPRAKRTPQVDAES